MSNLMLLVHTSLDGYVAGLNGAFDHFTNEPDNLEFVCCLTDEADAALFGRMSYQLLNQHWPTAADQPGATTNVIKYSEWYNRVPKFVVSKTLQAGEVNNATVISENIPTAIQEIKNKSDKNILIFGSPTLAHSVLELGLLDSIWILIHPVLFGAGIPLFRNGDKANKLQLKKTKQFSNGMIGLHYAIYPEYI
jgi:dihydrofolate reductase